MKKQLVAVLVGMFFLFCPQLGAQATAGQKTAGQSSETISDQDIKLLRSDIKSQKKQLIAENLQLTPAEATKFWPVYDQYQAEYAKIGDAKVALIKDYAQKWGTITEEQAVSYLKRSQDIEDSVIRLRMKYVPIVNQVLPGKKTATFFQLDRRLSLLLDIQLSSQIPLVQSQVK